MSSAQVYAEGAPATSTPRPRSNPRSSQPDARPARAGGNAADRLRNGERSRNAARANGQASNRNAGGDRRNKRLPSVFDGSSPARAERAPRGVILKGRDQQSQRMAAPKTTTDWNSPLYTKPGYERFLPSAPRASSIFTPNLSAAAAATPAAGGKGKGKAAAAPASTPQAKLNLPGIKTAVNALKLHIRPGGRNILGPTHDPVGVAVAASRTSALRWRHRCERERATRRWRAASDEIWWDITYDWNVVAGTVALVADLALERLVSDALRELERRGAGESAVLRRRGAAM
ncbi:hypothetical protein L1887_62855 [Cichorium endivia]|nr:hypothetical protein L1887_62855 [Cichorium endivia]